MTLPTLKPYRGYTATVQYSAADNVLYGQINLPSDLVSFHSDDLYHLQTEFENAVDDYIEACGGLGKIPEVPGNVIYLVTVCTKLEKDKNGWYDMGSTRIWGWYSDIADAKNVIENNITDIFEYYYTYAIIEEVKEGVPAFPLQKKLWYKWNTEQNKYLPIPEPIISHCLLNSIG